MLPNLNNMLLLLCILATGQTIAQPPNDWQRSWPHTDFSQSSVNLDDIATGGPGKDGIPAIDQPQFIQASESRNIADDEPVIGLILGNEAKAYPLRILIWHEIVNDVVGGTPVAVTYCPLCNTAIVFDRRLDGQLLDFGTTGNLRKSDLIMYDRQTESWWQQYAGDAIVGELAGKKLRTLASRLESFAQFRRRAPAGLVLIPSDPRARNYGANPYVGYDRSPLPFLFKGKLPKGVAPMMRVVAIGAVAFTLPYIKGKGRVEHGDVIVSWAAGQRSALDTRQLAQGRDVGNITVTRQGKDIPYVVTFAFAFFAFNPQGVLMSTDDDLRQQDLSYLPVRSFTHEPVNRRNVT